VNAGPRAPGVARGEPVVLRVDGMWCGSCAAAVEAVLGRQDGVVSARVGFATGTAVVEVDPAVVDAADLVGAVGKAGYQARLEGDPTADAEADEALVRDLRLRVALAAFLGMWAAVLAGVLHLTTPALVPPDARTLLGVASGALATLVVFGAGSQLLLAGWRTLRAGVPGMDTLVAIGAISAWALSMGQLLRGSDHVWFDTAAMLITFLLAGRLLELGIRRRGADAVRRLLDLSPEEATREDGTAVPAATVGVGERIAVPPGARVPLDGRVVAGRSRLDRSVLTGESVPVDVGVGDRVEAGTTNLDGPLTLEVDAALGDRALDRLAARVRGALDQRSPLADRARRLAERLVPAIGVLSTLVFAGTWGWTGSLEEAALRAVAVLVVTCPCALSLAVPLTTALAVTAAARRGLLFRSGEALHRAAGVVRVALDKTGTLTRGRPRVVDVLPASGVDRERLLRAAAGAEQGSEHVLARALRDAVPDAPTGGTREARPGAGIIWSTPSGRTVRVGRPDWVGVDLDLPDTGTPVAVAEDGHLLGVILLDDTPRPEAAAVVRALADRRPVLLSGDRPAVVHALAGRLGIATAHGDCRPEDKAAWLEAHPGTAFVGDGYNDAPALAAAHLGVAVQGATDAATGTADLVLPDDGLRALPDALALARRAHRITTANLAWALGYNALMVPLAATGWIHPGIAVLAMFASSITVSVNALRVGRGPRPRAVAHPAVPCDAAPP
jgi:P-type Cu+ transporter